MTAVAPTRPLVEAFSHEALFYAGDDEFVSATSSFVREGVAQGEPVLVVVAAHKIAMLERALGTNAAAVCFADMAEVGANPARIIPAWREFVDDHALGGRRFRGIGEPIDTGRSPAELVECQRHESLLNVAFAGGPAWRLLCPYDTAALGEAVLVEARRSHPVLVEKGAECKSADYCDVVAGQFDVPLPEPDAVSFACSFVPGPLDAVRRVVAQHAVYAGLDAGQNADVVLAVNELATNSLRHGGGSGTLRIWLEPRALICEVRDAGSIRELLVGRERPSLDRKGGRGLWLVNQLCDLVQLRSSDAGTVVRVHMLRTPQV